MRKKTKKAKLKLPFTKKPTKKYSFPVPIPPGSVVTVKNAARSPWAKEVGRTFRIGYYSKMDGLDCIWLVDETGLYDQALDHEYLDKFFDIQFIAKERSLYGRGRPLFGPIKQPGNAGGIKPDGKNKQRREAPG